MFNSNLYIFMCIFFPYLAANDIRPFVPSVLGRLVHILVNIRTPKTLPENTAICIGRLGSVCPDLVAPHLGEFAVQWCENMRAIKDNDEKDSAFRGMCSMIQLNSQPILTVSYQC